MSTVGTVASVPRAERLVMKIIVGRKIARSAPYVVRRVRNPINGRAANVQRVARRVTRSTTGTAVSACYAEGPVTQTMTGARIVKSAPFAVRCVPMHTTGAKTVSAVYFALRLVTNGTYGSAVSARIVVKRHTQARLSRYWWCPHLRQEPS